MSFWRPSNNCRYVISDINGMYNELNLILSRILPLRKTGGQIDKLIFLGNYTTGTFSCEILDTIISAIKENPGQIFCICGDNDIKLINAINNSDGNYYKLWLSSGGDLSLSGYMNKLGINTNPYLVQRQYISRFIPKEHIEFITRLPYFYETENEIFVHGGCDPNIPLAEQNPNILVNDSSVFKLVYNSSDNFRCPWNKTIITGCKGKLGAKPIIKDKFISLDSKYAERLYAMELNSMSIFSARKGKSRLVKESIT